MPFDTADIVAYNEEVKDWSRNNLGDLKAEITRLNIQHYPYSPSPVALAQALSQKTSERFGLINKVSIKMPRHAVFLVKGVSKGHPANNPREKKDWFNPVIDENLEELADIAAEHGGNMVVNALKIK